MKTALLIFAFLLGGCSATQDAEKAIDEIIKNCARPASIELRISTWSNEMTMRCEQIQIKPKNQPAKNGD